MRWGGLPHSHPQGLLWLSFSTFSQYFTLPPYSIWNPHGMQRFHGMPMESIWIPCGICWFHMEYVHGIHMEWIYSMDSMWIPCSFHGIIPLGFHLDSTWNEGLGIEFRNFKKCIDLFCIYNYYNYKSILYHDPHSME